MVDKLARALPAAVAGLFAVLLFVAGRGGDWAVWYLAIALLILSGGGMFIGQSILRSHPQAAVWLIDGWFVGIVVVNALFVLGAIALGVWISERVQGQLPSDNGMVKTVSGLAGVVLGALVTNIFADGATNSFWPPSIASRRARAVFMNYFPRASLAHEAVYDNRVVGTDSVTKKKYDFSGWGFIARHRRAQIIAKQEDAAPPGVAPT